MVRLASHVYMGTVRPHGDVGSRDMP